MGCSLVLPIEYASRMPLSSSQTDDLERILYHETTILSRLDEMARGIVDDYAGRELTVVAILHGSIIFVADLLRRIHLPLRVETISVSSYHGGIESSGAITFNHQDLPDFRGQHVLLVDDILDSGRTLAAIRERVLSECRAESVRICVLLRKRLERAEEVRADYVGFEIGDEFVVGYGLDYQGRYRNLPMVATLTPEAIEKGAGSKP
ncbi:hypoxanthine phosphoribosyltransferase [soil metagenome]